MVMDEPELVISGEYWSVYARMTGRELGRVHIQAVPKEKTHDNSEKQS